MVHVGHRAGIFGHTINEMNGSRSHVCLWVYNMQIYNFQYLVRLLDNLFYTDRRMELFI